MGDRFGPQGALGHTWGRVYGPLGRSGASAPEGGGFLGGPRSVTKMQKVCFSLSLEAKCVYFQRFSMVDLADFEGAQTSL